MLFAINIKGCVKSNKFFFHFSLFNTAIMTYFTPNIHFKTIMLGVCSSIEPFPLCLFLVCQVGLLVGMGGYIFTHFRISTLSVELKFKFSFENLVEQRFFSFSIQLLRTRTPAMICCIYNSNATLKSIYIENYKLKINRSK